VHNAFAGYVDYVPAWVWLLWVPQLLTSLFRLEHRAVRSVLHRLIRQYPQAIYHAVRALVMEKKETRQTVQSELQRQHQSQQQRQQQQQAQQQAGKATTATTAAVPASATSLSSSSTSTSSSSTSTSTAAADGAGTAAATLGLTDQL
jgi:transformation/transcription domain-associated protein